MSLMPTLDAAATETSNWIPDVNRYGIPKPPAWFLKVLWDQDSALVLIPSRQSRKYILARRRDRSKVIANIVQHEIDERIHKRVRYSDSDMLAQYKLVVVDSIRSITGNLHQASWMASTPEMMQELRERDMWAAGGAEKYIEKIEERERTAAQKKRANLLDDLDHRAGDAWRSYQARTGQRNQHANSGVSTKVKLVHAGRLD